MYTKMMRFVESDKQDRSFDYAKLAVYNEKNKYLTNIYKHQSVFYNLFERTPFLTVEDCLASLPKYIKTKVA